MAKPWLVVLCVLSANAWGAQLFIPIGPDGMPVEPVDPAPSAAELEPPPDEPAETPQAQAARLAAEAAHTTERERLTRDYVVCLETQRDRWLGTDYAACAPLREELSRYHPEELQAEIASCIEEGVLGTSVSGGSGACDWLSATYAREVRIGVRWP